MAGCATPTGPAGHAGAAANVSAFIAALQPTLVLDETDDLVDALSRAQIAQDERPRAAHALGVALRDRERGADVGRVSTRYWAVRYWQGRY